MQTHSSNLLGYVCTAELESKRGKAMKHAVGKNSWTEKYMYRDGKHGRGMNVAFTDLFP